MVMLRIKIVIIQIGINFDIGLIMCFIVRFVLFVLFDRFILILLTIITHSEVIFDTLRTHDDIINKDISCILLPIYFAILMLHFSFSLFLAFYPKTIIDISFLVEHFTSSSHLVSLPCADVFVTISIELLSLSFFLVLTPFTYIQRTILIIHFASPMSFVVKPIAFVTVVGRVGAGPMPIALTVQKGTLVLFFVFVEEQLFGTGLRGGGRERVAHIDYIGLYWIRRGFYLVWFYWKAIKSILLV